MDKGESEAETESESYKKRPKIPDEFHKYMVCEEKLGVQRTTVAINICVTIHFFV